MRRLLPLLLLALVAALFVGGRMARGELGLEFTQESIRTVVSGLGWRAPALFIGLVTFRQFLLLPSGLVLPVGGIVFGAAKGALLGGVGILISALLQYSLARGLGRDWLRPGWRATLENLERSGRTLGPWLVALATAHPAGPMTPLHWGSGFARVPLWTFVLAVAAAAPVRAFAYAFFGSTLLEIGTPRFWVATGLLVAVFLLPLAHRGTRERLFARFRPGGRRALDVTIDSP